MSGSDETFAALRASLRVVQRNVSAMVPHKLVGLAAEEGVKP